MGYSPAQKGAIDLAKRSLVDSIYTSCKVEGLDRKSTRLNSSHLNESRMPSSA